MSCFSDLPCTVATIMLIAKTVCIMIVIIWQENKDDFVLIHQNEGKRQSGLCIKFEILMCLLFLERGKLQVSGHTVDIFLGRYLNVVFNVETSF